MQVNSFFKKVRLWIVIVPTILFTLFVIYKFGALAFSPQKPLVPEKPAVERGSIVDRNGKPLAVQTNFYHFGVSPETLDNTHFAAFANDIAPVLGMDSNDILTTLNISKDKSFVYIKKKISEEQYESLKKIIDAHDYYYAAVRFDRIPGRVYPENELASQLIGYMGDDGEGLSGIEYSEQAVLAPPVDKKNPKAVFGKNVYLTIDANLQYKLEKIAKDAMTSTQAESIMLIAAEAKTGEILTYLSLPSADLNAYGTASTEQKVDRPAVNAYEPGSVFKIFSVASFLDSGIITPDTIFLCDGLYEKRSSSGERIRITCLEHHGWVNARDALKFSCNDALAQMSDLIDTDSFLARVHSFGFGERTGVELPGETRGIVKSRDDKYWSGRTKATMSIGQEISVSALQMVQAASAIADGGTPVQLTFIQRITDKDGNVEYTHEPQFKQRIIKASTAKYVLSCMETTAQSGTGSRAALGDISIGVKTGTAQMADPVHGGYSNTDFLSNCIAIFPVEDPEIILYIVIQKAKGETYAGRIVAPVIAQAADEIIDHLGMNRAGAASLSHNGKIQISSNKPISIGKTVPDFTGRPKRDLLPLLERDDIHFTITGEGWVVNQTPAPGTPVTENMTIELTLE
jgi:cell division protein FtsI (penicillin-binding protein 3)